MLVIADIAVSRRHIQIHLQSNGYRMQDMGSPNGTMINGKRVADTLLVDGDQIEVGNSLLRFEHPPSRPQQEMPPAPPPAPPMMAPPPAPPMMAPPAYAPPQMGYQQPGYPQQQQQQQGYMQPQQMQPQMQPPMPQLQAPQAAFPSMVQPMPSGMQMRHADGFPGAAAGRVGDLGQQHRALCRLDRWDFWPIRKSARCTLPRSPWRFPVWHHRADRSVDARQRDRQANRQGARQLQHRHQRLYRRSLRHRAQGVRGGAPACP